MFAPQQTSSKQQVRQVRLPPHAQVQKAGVETETPNRQSRLTGQRESLPTGVTIDPKLQAQLLSQQPKRAGSAMSRQQPKAQMMQF